MAGWNLALFWHDLVWLAVGGTQFGKSEFQKLGVHRVFGEQPLGRQIEIDPA